MAKTKNDKDTLDTPADTNPPATGPEAEGQRSAATLEEAMAQQQEIATGQSEDIAAEGEATAEETAAAYEAERAEAEAALIARDDEVYGRTPEAKDAEAERKAEDKAGA
jgi:hypothetical protein